MFNFENQICGVCGKSFDKDSDIVVCPDCGTPHHRECWHQIGHCVNRDKHDAGFEWQPENKEVPSGSIICPECGSVMSEGTLFCENCGKALKTAPNISGGYADLNGEKSEPRQIMPAGMPSYNESFNRYVESEFSGEIDGFPIKEIAAFIGPNSVFYIRKFKKLNENKKTLTFSGLAFLFTPLWFLYRKMWSVAIGTAAFNFVTRIPTLIITAAEMGLLPSNSPLMFSGIENVSSVLSIISILVSFVFGFLAVPMFKKSTIKKMTKIKEESKGDKQLYYKMLIEKSGPSKFGALMIIIFTAMLIFTLFMPY